MMQIYIESKLIELPTQGVKIPKTYKKFSFLDLGSAIADSTARLKLPLTKSNKVTLELIAPLDVITSKPYKNLDVLIIEDGITLINGVCQIVSLTQEPNGYFEIDCQTKIKKFFDAIDGKTLNDLDTSAYDVNGINDIAIQNSITNTSGFIFPAISNNHYTYVPASFSVDAFTELFKNIPCFYYKTVIDMIFTLSGFTKSGTVFSDTNRYSKLIFNLSYLLDQKWLDAKYGEMTKSTSQTFNDTGAGIPVSTKVTFTEGVSGSDNFVDLPNSRYIIGNTHPSGGTSWFPLKHIFTGNIVSNGMTTVQVAIKRNGFNLVTQAVSISDKSFTLEYTNEVGYGRNNDIFEAYILSQDISGSAKTCVISNFKMVQQGFQSTDTNPIFGTLTNAISYYADWRTMMPRIYLKDVIKDFMVMFGLVMKPIGNNIEFVSIESMMNATPRLDLSNKDSKSTGSISYSLKGKFAQKNYFRWKTLVEIDPSLLNENFSRGELVVGDTSLPFEKDSYLSIFTASVTGNKAQLTGIVLLNVYQGGGVWKNAISYGTRLMMTRDSDNVNIRFIAGNNRTTYKIAYFVDRVAPFSLDYQLILDLYYNRYESALQNFLSLKRKFSLSLVKAESIDQFVPQTIDAQSYILESLSNVITGVSAEATLIKI